MKIKVAYSCFACGVRKAWVEVPAREAEGVVDWVQEVVMPCLAADHITRSPDCQATTVQDLMIPISGVHKVGGPPVQ